LRRAIEASDRLAQMEEQRGQLEQRRREIQQLMQEIRADLQVLGNNPASQELKVKFFSSISSRAADMIREELEVMGPVKLSAVEAAQQEIVKIARQLEEEGKLVLAGKGGGESLV